MKYVLISGGVVSGIGKGITSSSMGVLLRACGLRVTSIKIDPYLNTDAGTMSPYEHGEVFVLDDGGEADLDLGNYERFLEVRLTRDHNITTGKIYQSVIDRERKGDYLGKTVQVVPHITDAIQEWIERVASIPVDGSKNVPEVCLIELGGTVGDIESMVFLEALRQFRYRVGADNLCHVHVSLVPVVGAVGEPKSKPTQHAVKELRAAGLNPDIIVCRSSKPLDRSVVHKISLFCMVPPTHVVSVHDVSNIYKVPQLLLEQRIPYLVLGCLKLNKFPPESLPKWQQLATRVDSSTQEVKIGIVGKYTGLSDSYLSVTHALTHAAIEADCKLNVVWIDSEKLEEGKNKVQTEFDAAWAALASVEGILIPGGFGDRGIKGKIAACKYARTKGIPYLGICLGLQIAVIEYSLNVLELKDANSTEFDEDCANPVVIFMPEGSTTHKGGTMRLGSRRSTVKTGSIAHQLYDWESHIDERHRHRYEVNPDLVEKLEKAGLIFSAQDDSKRRMECVELPVEKHPFFFGTQFHPEFKSTPMNPSPPFRGFVQASAKKFVRETAPSSNSNGGKRHSPTRKPSQQVEHKSSAPTATGSTPNQKTVPSTSPDKSSQSTTTANANGIHASPEKPAKPGLGGVANC